MANRTPHDLWAEQMVQAPQSGEQGELDLFGLAPWDQITQEQAILQWQKLLGLEAELRPEVASLNRFTDEEMDYLQNTPIEDLTPEWRQYALKMSGAIEQLEWVHQHMAAATEQFPDLAQYTALAAQQTGPSRPGVPTGQPPATSTSRDHAIGSADADTGPPVGLTDDTWSEYERLMLDSQNLSNEMLQVQIEAQKKALSQSQDPLAKMQQYMSFGDFLKQRQRDAQAWDWQVDDRDYYTSERDGPIAMATKNLGFMDYLRDRKWQKEDRERAIAAQQAALAHQAWSRAFQQRQLGAQVANNLGNLQQNAWQYVGQNALPAGTDHVPGFGPDSRLAGILGPSFPGLPTVTLDTPDPRAPYAWAQRYAAGG